MKKLLLSLCVLCSACATSLRDEFADSTEDYYTVINQGKPVTDYRMDRGSHISFYEYDNKYYYPYVWNGHWYLQPFKFIKKPNYIFRPEKNHKPIESLKGPDVSLIHDYGEEHFK